MRRVPLRPWLLLCASCLFACGKQDPPINRVGVNVVEKSLFQGSWYMSRVVVDVAYEANGLGTFPGDAASDAAGDFTSMPRIRWVIDENTLYAYRDYQLVQGGDGQSKAPAPAQSAADGGVPETGGNSADDSFSLPVAAYKIEKHFDIKRDYEPSTGENHNVIVENDTDRPWYERQFMRVDWSKNLLPGYFGQTKDLQELLGQWTREPVDLYVQDASKFPASYRPQFQRMRCKDQNDQSCPEYERDLAPDYDQGELYHMSFVSQEALSPAQVTDPNTGQTENWCADKLYTDAPPCSSFVTYVRTSFLKKSDKRQYVPQNYPDARFDRFGYFRLSTAVDDRSTGDPADPSFGVTDFRNYAMNRHNIWLKWTDGDGNPIPYKDRKIRKIVWYTTSELPAHLVEPSFDVVGRWNEVFMQTVRRLRGEPLPSYPDVTCQKDDPDGYCYCDVDSDTGLTRNPTCPGQYDPFKRPEDYGGDVENPYDCWVDVPDAARNMDMNNAALSDSDFNPWFGAKFTGDECVTILRINTCNKGNLPSATATSSTHSSAVADAGITPMGADDPVGLDCQERGDLRFKFLSYVAMPGTSFLGVATLRGDPVTGEILAGDANIGGPALDSYRTSALQTYDLIQGNLNDLQLEVGEDVRGYFENLGHVSLPAQPRGGFDVAPLSMSNTVRQEIDNRMQSIAGRLSKLQGPDGRQNVLSDRKQKLIGSDLERRLVAGLDAQSSSDQVDPNATVSSLTDADLNKLSPLRNTISMRLAAQHDKAQRYSMANFELGNEYTDDSVQWFVSRHQDWPRARLEFEINRLLYRQTVLHEMGHCLGLRHDFGASADTDNYRDEYYDINQRYPLPNSASFDKDNNGLSDQEAIQYEQAYTDTRSKREKAGINGAMSSSVMEYTANWYERIQPLGKYDNAAIAFGYGDMEEAYTAPGKQTTPRTMVHYYQGGETCNQDSDCPYAMDGAHAGDLLQENLDHGITQHCVDNPRTSDSKMCSNSDDDIAAQSQDDGALQPLSYRFCSDERADSTLGWCSRFDEGDSYREIVRNVEDSYDRMYVFSAFRRYRSNFSANTYEDALIGRRLNILQVIYQNLLYQYLNVPEFRKQEGVFGFYDQFLATTDILNFYARILAQPDVGGYQFNAQTSTYIQQTENASAPNMDLAVPLGFGRYFFSDYQSGLTGIERVERIGSFYDKARVIELLAERGGNPNYTRDVAFYANFYDVFPNEIQQIFTGMIRDFPKAYMPRVVCNGAPANSNKCPSPELVYMDFYRGDCSKSATCRPDPANVTYGDLPVLDGGASITLQTYAALYGLSDFPVYFDTTFDNQLFVCIEGQAECYTPGDKAVEGVDYVRYTSPRYNRTFLAYQVEPTQAAAGQASIGFAMVKEARDLNIELQALRKERDGAKPYSIDNLTADDLKALADVNYDAPTTPPTIDSEINRVDSRVVDLESFLNQLIELETKYGIQGIQYFQ